MKDSKPWWSSKTIWGAFVAVVAGLASEVGIQMSPDEVAQLGDSLTNVVTVIGGIWAIYGRVRADRIIK